MNTTKLGMDIRLRELPPVVTRYEVKRALADSFFHNPLVNPHWKDGQRLVNFEVELNVSRISDTRNDGTGIITVPTKDLGFAFLAHHKKCPITIGFEDNGVKKKHRIKVNQRYAPKGQTPQDQSAKQDFYIRTTTLAKTPYINPDKEQERKALEVLAAEYSFIVQDVQFGTYYRDWGTVREKELGFSIEWGQTFDGDKSGHATMKFEYNHKLIRIILTPKPDRHADPETPQYYAIAIAFSNINRVAIGNDGSAYLIFDTTTPCTLESLSDRPTKGTKYDDLKYKRRVSSVHPGHGAIAEYAHTLRVTLWQQVRDHVETFHDVISKFTELFTKLGLSRSQLYTHGVEATATQKFFAPKILDIISKDKVLMNDWPIAFQVEALLRSGYFNTSDLRKILQPAIVHARKKLNYDAEQCGVLLAKFSQQFRASNLQRSPQAILNDLMDRSAATQPLKTTSSEMNCYRATFTPSRMILDGPLPSSSNRILRQYADYWQHFIRVDFRDEDKMTYRWDRAVDGHSFVKLRVGSVLKEGFSIAKRPFEFLAYSSSALREHTVWFINPFDHPVHGRIDGERLRQSIGEFAGTQLIKQPSRFAARLAQAFTATKPGVMIKREEWEVTPDIGQKPYLHTDGCGTIAPSLGRRIWEKSLSERPELDQYIEPFVYQIRFLGFKGIVSIDPLLEGGPVLMRLRDSMKKFDGKEDEGGQSELEIVMSFYTPSIPYFNRPLIMILEDLGVDSEVFQGCQDDAIREIQNINDSSEHLRRVLYSRRLAGKFRLVRTLQALDDLGGTMRPSQYMPCYDNPFLQSVRNVVKATLLRDVKHGARIPVDGHFLIGMADEGPAYIERGFQDVYCLKEGQVYACIQRNKDEKPVWVTGECVIARSPMIHPGDVRRVYAIGEPPKGILCAFGAIRNAVVFSAQGRRSLPSMLGGGDLDGDMYMLMTNKALLFPIVPQPAEYEVHEPWTLPHGQEAGVNDICDFVVQYINSDVLGLLSDRFLVIADQSIKGVFDPDCERLARLCSQAVDYPKNGIPVSLQNFPHTLINYKPDWHAAEIVNPYKADYYESEKALGKLFRDPNLDFPEDAQANKAGLFRPVLPNPISKLLAPRVTIFLPHLKLKKTTLDLNCENIFAKYVAELRYICFVNTLTDTAGVHLLEAEVVVGTILAKCTQRRMRSSRMEQMRLHTDILIGSVMKEVSVFQGTGKVEEMDREQVVRSLRRAWELWEFTTKRTDVFGGNSLGWLALRMVLEYVSGLEKMDQRMGAAVERSWTL